MNVDEAREIIAKKFFGYKEGWTGEDCDGKNNSLVLIPPSFVNSGYVYPPKGAIGRLWHVPQWHTDSNQFLDLLKYLLSKDFHLMLARVEACIERGGIEQGVVWDWKGSFKEQFVITVAMFIEEEEREEQEYVEL